MTQPRAATQPDAIVAVIHRADVVLVIQRAVTVPYSGYWTPPSGRVEPGETHWDAVVREMREELTLDVVPDAKVWECDTHDGTYRLHWWTVTLTDPSIEPVPDPTEVADVRWVRPEDFGALSPTFADDRRFFTDIWPARA